MPPSAAPRPPLTARDILTLGAPRLRRLARAYERLASSLVAFHLLALATRMLNSVICLQSSVPALILIRLHAADPNPD